MFKMLREIGRAKNLPCQKADLKMLAVLAAVALMTVGLYAYKKCTGVSQTLGAAVFVIIFILLFFSFVGWLVFEAFKDCSRELREEEQKGI